MSVGSKIILQLVGAMGILVGMGGFMWGIITENLLFGFIVFILGFSIMYYSNKDLNKELLAKYDAKPRAKIQKFCEERYGSGQAEKSAKLMEAVLKERLEGRWHNPSHIELAEAAETVDTLMMKAKLVIISRNYAEYWNIHSSPYLSK